MREQRLRGFTGVQRLRGSRGFTRVQRSRGSRGFTLIEVIAALAISAVVITLAESALRAGLDVRERVTANRDGVEAEARLRSWLVDMLRHPAPASRVDGALFQIASSIADTPSGMSRSVTSDSDAIPTDAVRLISQGVESPYGTGPLWRVTLTIEAGALHLRATPLGRDNVRASIETVLPHIVGLRAEALEGAGGNASGWRHDWPLLRAMPSAVRLTFVRRERDGMLSSAPFVVETAPLSGVAP